MAKEKINKIKVDPKSCTHGFCPDCGCRLDYDRSFEEYQCTSKDCCFVADKNGNRVWDNDMREEEKQQMRKSLKREMEDYYSIDY